ncbi:DUF6925 family protein [Methylobacterium sp. A54F]
MTDAHLDLIRDALALPGTTWSLGTFGAGATLLRTGAEGPLADGRLGFLGAGGGLALSVPPGLAPVAYETPLGTAWSQAVALCLPEDAPPAAPSGGADAGALRPEDRDAPLFDLGHDLWHAALRARARGPEAQAWLAGLRGAAEPERVLRAQAEGAVDLVVLSPLGRLEVFGGARPGAGAYLVPRVLRTGRRHAATAPIPPGLVVHAQFLPPRDAFPPLLARWGLPHLRAAKAGRLPADAPRDRWTRAAERVGRLQRGLPEDGPANPTETKGSAEAAD